MASSVAGRTHATAPAVVLARRVKWARQPLGFVARRMSDLAVVVHMTASCRLAHEPSRRHHPDSAVQPLQSPTCRRPMRPLAKRIRSVCVLGCAWLHSATAPCHIACLGCEANAVPVAVASHVCVGVAVAVVVGTAVAAAVLLAAPGIVAVVAGRARACGQVLGAWCGAPCARVVARHACARAGWGMGRVIAGHGLTALPAHEQWLQWWLWRLWQ